MAQIKFEKLSRGKDFMYDLGGEDKSRKYKKLESEYVLILNPSASKTDYIECLANCVCLEAGDLAFCPYDQIVESIESNS
ncbi:hypothetical protein KKC45_02285 [Patescibacteria group bacterium]|nr:hypothetical protein [Patescibacteria group bacterium]